MRLLPEPSVLPLGLYERDYIADGMHLLRVGIGNLDLKGIFQRHDHLDDIEARGLEVFHEPRLVAEVGDRQFEMARDCAFYAITKSVHAADLLFRLS